MCDLRKSNRRKRDRKERRGEKKAVVHFETRRDSATLVDRAGDQARPHTAGSPVRGSWQAAPLPKDRGLEKTGMRILQPAIRLRPAQIT